MLGQLLKALQTPWKWSLRVSSWNTFQLGPRKAHKPLLAKKFEPEDNNKTQVTFQPSVHCCFILMSYFSISTQNDPLIWDVFFGRCFISWKAILGKVVGRFCTAFLCSSRHVLFSSNHCSKPSNFRSTITSTQQTLYCKSKTKTRLMWISDRVFFYLWIFRFLLT